jgi:hypothetical protein
MIFVWNIGKFNLIGHLYSHAMYLGYFCTIAAVVCAVLSIVSFVGGREDIGLSVTTYVSLSAFILPLLSAIWIHKWK